ncbi:MAG: GNAT family N-acetyltransferase [Flavobacterium sp.]|nr:GNAT family N-acetyltransferase [Pedobacter sp.]
MDSIDLEKSVSNFDDLFTVDKVDYLNIMPFRLVTVHEKDLWNHYVHSCKMYDFYHTWYYHSLDKSGEPILFVFQREETFIVFPLIKRLIEGTSFSDFTSVYGYAGPISNVDFETMSQAVMEDFKLAFLLFLKDGQNVSVFCRLHPIINHDLLVTKFGSMVNSGKTIAINLISTIEEQRSKYRRQFRSKIRQLREKGYYLKQADTTAEISEFTKIYNENMARVKADSYYHFDENYFVKMLNSDDFKSSVLLLYVGDQITCGAYVTFSNNIMQFHLAATNNNFLHEGPMKLLIDEATLIGRNNNMAYLHLGGGVGGKEDSLFDFKAGFSDLILNFNTWRFIANNTVYDELVLKKKNAGNNKSDFFPLYRDSNNL